MVARLGLLLAGNWQQTTTVTANVLDAKGIVTLARLTVTGLTKLNAGLVTGDLKVNGSPIDHSAIENRLVAVEGTLSGITKETANGISKWMIDGSFEAWSVQVIASTLTTSSTTNLNGLNVNGAASFNSGLTASGQSTLENLVVNGMLPCLMFLF